MCEFEHHPWSLPTGLPCVGTGSNHTRQFEASDGADCHDESEQAAERSRG